MSNDFLKITEEINKAFFNKNLADLDQELIFRVFKYFSFEKAFWFTEIVDTWQVKFSYVLKDNEYVDTFKLVDKLQQVEEIAKYYDLKKELYFQRVGDKNCSLVIFFETLGYEDSTFYFLYEKEKSQVEIQEIITIFNLMLLFFFQNNKDLKNQISDYKLPMFLDLSNTGVIKFKKTSSDIILQSHNIDKIIGQKQHIALSRFNDFYNYIYHEDRVEFKNLIANLNEDEEKDFRIVTSKAIIKYCSFVFSLIENEDGEKTFVLFIKDITDKKDLILQIENLNKKMELIIDSVREILIFIDRDGILREIIVPKMNYNYLKLDKYLNKSYKDLDFPSPEFKTLKKEIEIALIKGKKNTKKKNFIFKMKINNRLMTFDIVFTPKFDINGNFDGSLISLFDITLFDYLNKTKKINNFNLNSRFKSPLKIFSKTKAKELIEINQKLEEMNKEELVYFLAIGNEMKNCLNNMMASTQVLAHKEKDLNNKKILLQIENHVRQLSNLLNIITELKTYNNLPIVETRDKIEVDGFVAKIVKRAESVFDNYLLTCNFEIEENLPSVIFSNEEMLLKLVYNFIDFSLIFTKQTNIIDFKIFNKKVKNLNFLVFETRGLDRLYNKEELEIVYNFDYNIIDNLDFYDSGLIVLSLINKLINLVGGQFFIENINNKSNFSLALPI